MKIFRAFILLSLIVIHYTASADLDSHQKQGLDDTKTMLKSPEKRREAIKNDKDAQAVDAKVEALAGTGKNKEEIYDLASQVMESIAVESKGDPEKMQKLLLEAQTNPEAFYKKYFTEAQKAKVRGVAADIEKKGTKGPSPR